MMQRLLEYRLKVLHLTPNNGPMVEAVSPWIPANLGEMYEVYQSRVDRGRDPSGFNQMYIWKVLEPHRYYYDDGSEKQVDLFGAIEWPFGSPDTTVCEWIFLPYLCTSDIILWLTKRISLLKKSNTKYLLFQYRVCYVRYWLTPSHFLWHLLLPLLQLLHQVSS